MEVWQSAGIWGKKPGASQELDGDRHELEAGSVQDSRDRVEGAVMTEVGSLQGAELRG